MTTSHPAEIEGLAGRLRALRRDAGVSQMRAAEHVGVSQGKISRAETGRFLLDPGTVGKLAELYGANDAQRAELVGWAEDLRPQRLDSRLIMQRGTNHFQERIRRIEEASSQVRSYQPGLVLVPCRPRRTPPRCSPEGPRPRPPRRYPPGCGATG